MTYSRILASLLILLFITACEPNQQELNTIKRAEVIAVHDEVMPTGRTEKPSKTSSI